MMNITSLVLFFLVFFMIFYIVQSDKPWMDLYTPLHKNTLVAGIYFLILLAAVPLYYGLSGQNFIQANAAKNAVTIRSQADLKDSYGSRVQTKDFWGKVQRGEVYQSSRQIFKLTANSLSFHEPNEGNVPYPILVQRKDEMNGEMEVSTYNLGVYIGDIDLTKAVLPPTFTMENGTLSINAPAKQTFHFKRLENDFVLKQFKPVDAKFQDSLTSFYGGTVILVKVPQDLDIQTGSYAVQFVD